jgi:hypothetical protein
MSKLLILILLAVAFTFNGWNIGRENGIKSVKCPACQECGYRLPGLDLIDAVPTKTDKATLKMIAVKETRGRHYVVIEGHSGERGMMQIHPVHGDECYGIGDVSLPENNVKCGDLVFQNCLRLHKGNKPAALCCYNGAEIENGSCEYAEGKDKP